MNTLTPPRFPSAGLIDCRVKIGGRVVAVGDPTDAATAPYVLSGLTIDWGRDTTVDQPSAGTCRLAVADPVGDQVAGVTVYVGQTVEVTASAKVPGAPTVSTHHDPGWSTSPLGAAGAAASTSRATTAAVAVSPSGRRALRVGLPMDDTTGTDGPAVVRIPPAPFVTYGTAPAAWDAVPKMTPGQTWRAGITVNCPLGVIAEVYPVAYSAPWSGTGRRIGWRTGAPLTVTAAEAWTAVAGDLQTPAEPAWLGLEVVFYDTALASWAGQPAGTTYTTMPARTFQQLGTAWCDDVLLLAPAAGTTQTVSVFAGRVTDAAARYLPGAGLSVTELTATDFVADLANVYVGDQPWPAETAQNRMQRVLNLAGSTLTLLADSRPAAVMVSARDVDRRSAGELLTEVASSVDAVIRAAVHPVTGPYLRLEDPAGRPALRKLAIGAGGLVGIFPVTAPPGASTLDADLIEMDDVEWQQSVSDVVTRVQVTWREQTTPPTDRYLTVTDDSGRRRLGERSATLSSQLTSSASAQLIGQQLLARLSDGSSWRIAGLTIDTTVLTLDSERIATVLPLLDGTARIGRPLQLVGIPEWWPAPDTSLALYLEGGTLTHAEGCWQLSLTTSSPNGLGDSVAYNEIPAGWTYQMFPPGLSYTDLTGVAGP